MSRAELHIYYRTIISEGILEGLWEVRYLRGALTYCAKLYCSGILYNIVSADR